MMLKVVWAPKAEQDFEDIIYYLRTTAERPLTARRIGEEILAIIDKCSVNSDLGGKHFAAPADWRYIRHKRWLVFYKPASSGIEVMRVIDGSRDLPKAIAEFHA